MNIREAIAAAKAKRHTAVYYEAETGTPAGEVRADRHTLQIRDTQDGESVFLPLSLFDHIDDTPAKPTAPEYACELSRVIDKCVRDPSLVVENKYGTRIGYCKVDQAMILYIASEEESYSFDADEKWEVSK